MANMIGQIFGNLTVLSFSGKNSWGRFSYSCLCICGREKVVAKKYLISGHTKSCGCLRAETTIKRLYRHGFSHKDEHNIWQGIKQRCYNEKRHNFERYGGRGIGMCDLWKNSFESFYADMGKRPSKIHSIDRINVNGNYEPNNCRWATPITQRRNRR